uniref:Transmembrane and ubiquitin-like domain containing 2 n=1 Tax=Tetraodon nigroviridis TaxID=99883 RepID=H3CF74_TETNG
TMLDGMEDEVTAAGGVLLLALALVLAWLSTHVADRGDHILGTILTVGAHASLIGLGGHDSYGAGPPSADAPEQQSAPPSQENKPDEAGSEGGEEGTGEQAEGPQFDLLLDIQSKQVQSGGPDMSEEEDDDEDDEELEEDDKKTSKHFPVFSEVISPAMSAATASISVRLKFLNDTEEVAVVDPQDTVERLKSKYFSGREHQIKLIYQGQLLQDPKRTLLSLNITHNSVIHCHVSQSLQEPAAEEASQPGAGASGGFRAAGVAISTSSLVVPVFVVILAVVWYFRINYRQFTAPATVSLVGVTVFFSFLIFGMHHR